MLQVGKDFSVRMSTISEILFRPNGNLIPFEFTDRACPRDYICMRHPVARQLSPLFAIWNVRNRTFLMPITESSARRLILQAGWTCLVLDKVAGKATLERKFLFWKLKPVEVRLLTYSI